MEYTILKSTSIEKLIVQVNTHIQQGWQPQGGISHSVFYGAANYFQAMVKA